MDSVRPLPLARFDTASARGVRGVLTDIDDTLTREGAIEPAALAALHALREAAIPVIAITGRPMGWSQSFARDWPLEAIVAENGAVALVKDAQADDGVHVEYAQDAPTRRANALRLRATAERVLRKVPGSHLAEDSAGRVTDIAVDHSEFHHLAPAQIAAVVALMQAAGMTATVSSIHINGWYGAHDKLSGARWIVQRLFGRELDMETAQWVYIGDSTNDQLMFGHFPASVGVANLMRFEAELTVWPTYLTAGERGDGFAQVARHLIAARR